MKTTQTEQNPQHNLILAKHIYGEHSPEYKMMQAEALGYADASEQFKTQGCFSSGRTWDHDPEMSNAYDQGVNRAEAEHNAAPAQAQHSPLPWKADNQAIYDANGSLISDCLTVCEGDADYIVRACNNAQRLADALTKLIHFEDEYYRPMAHTGGGIALKDAKKALAEWRLAQ